MKFFNALIITIFVVFMSFGQTGNNSSDLNLGFENFSANAELPDKWSQFGNGYSVKVDKAEKKSGINSIVIEPLGDKAENSFSSVASNIPANYQGKEIELRGFLKYKDVTNGYVGLWMRIDGDSETLQFRNMQSSNLNGSADWAQYSIKIPLYEEGVKLTFGAMHTGKGQLWVDDFQLLVDGKDISEAKTRPPFAYKAKSDKEFDGGSKISQITLSKNKIEDLTVLGKVWGFLKYHHPAIAKGDYNWDYELFRILPKIQQAKNPAERNNILSVWVESLGTFEAGAEKLPTENVKLSPDLAWINNKALGDKLASQLNSVRDAKRLKKHYYIAMNQGPGNPLFKNEDDYKALIYPDAGYRLLSLFRYWNIIHYYFPNTHLIEEGWSSVLPQFIPRFINAANELEYKKAALALIGRVHDTHAVIMGPDETLSKYRGLNSPAVAATFIEEKAVVTKYWDQALAEKSGLKIGDVIEAINDRKIADIVKERLEFTPASNYPTKLRDIGRYLLQTNDASLKIKYRRGTAPAQEISIEAYSKDKLKINSLEYYYKQIPPFKLIQPDIAYLYPGTLKTGEIAQLIPEIAKTKGLVIDLRSYPSDFIVFSLGDYLVSNPTDFVKFSGGSITTPGLFTFRGGQKVGKNNSNFYKGKVIILINEITQSNAEYTTMAFRASPQVTVIGSTTSGADGNVSEFFLPGGIKTRISGIGIYYPDGRETQRIGIVPDIVVKPTIKGITEGKDELLDKAIEIIKAK